MSSYIYDTCDGILHMAAMEAGPGCEEPEYQRLERIMRASEDLLDALVRLQTAAYNIGGEHITDYSQLIEAADAADSIIAKARGKS